MVDEILQNIATRLRQAEIVTDAIDPFANELGEGNILRAYELQHHNTDYWMKNGRVFCGRKIGLTAEIVQKQLGVDEPDYGALFEDMQIADGGFLDLETLIDPRIEAEIALTIGRDVRTRNLTIEELAHHVAYATPSLEIVDSRLKNWQIGIVDTIADNGASAKFVLGKEHVELSKIDLATSQMQLTRNGAIISTGLGAATLGHPLKALGWLTNILLQHDRPLLEGDIVLTGALGPVSKISRGDIFKATFVGLPAVTMNVR